jgi:hypothetical protein
MVEISQMSAIQRINTRRIVDKLQTDIKNVLSSANPFISGSNLVKDQIKQIIGHQLTHLQQQNVINQWVTDVKADNEGRIMCSIKFQVPLSVNSIQTTFTVDKMLQGHFYAILKDDKWVICAEEDLYNPDYSPMVVVIGEDVHDWELCTQEEILKRGVRLDEIMVWTENFVLPTE